MAQNRRVNAPVLARTFFTVKRRENLNMLIIGIALLLLFTGAGGVYWGLGLGWGIGPVGLIVAALVIAFLLFGNRESKGSRKRA
jgi:hypothetical protein